MNKLTIEDLPGEEFATQGFYDLAAGVDSIGSLLLEIAAPRLQRSGLRLPTIPPAAEAAEFRLYDLLEATDVATAYSQYSAWLKRLSRFCTAVENRAYLHSHAGADGAPEMA